MTSSGARAPEAGQHRRRPPPGRLAALREQLRWTRQDLSPEERREILSQLFFDGDRRRPYLYRFFTLLTLAVVIASFGLMADSAAVVIGAMLVAPLMTPIQAVAASLVMGWEKRQLRSLGLVAVGAAWSIGLGYGLGLIAPDRVTLPGEVLARTSPTLFDLAIALAAGAAGAYTLVRRESSALPGVAVAVALVPPLAVVGLTLENGDGDLALGALLLFGTNLVAIILAASLVLLVTGFTPRSLAERHRALIRRGVFLSVIAVLVVAVPLGVHSQRIISDARDRHNVEDAIDTWLGDEDDYDVTLIHIDGDDVEIEIVGPREPADLGLLGEAINEHLGEDGSVSVRWIQRTEIVVR